MNEEGIIGIAIYLACDKTKKNEKKKRFWMKEWLKKRNTFSHHNLLDELRLSSPSDYRNYLRIDYTTFSELLNMISPMIEKQSTCMENQFLRPSVYHVRYDTWLPALILKNLRSLRVHLSL